jgi:hypothetical protein
MPCAILKSYLIFKQSCLPMNIRKLGVFAVTGIVISILLELRDQGLKFRAVADRFGAGNHDASAARQRQQQFQYGNVERQRGHGEQGIDCGDTRLPSHRTEKIDHSPMR